MVVIAAEKDTGNFKHGIAFFTSFHAISILSAIMQISRVGLATLI
jgi:hypothetical protein